MPELTSDIGKYIPLMNIVSLFLDQYSKQGLFNKDQIWLIGLRGLTEMNFDISGEPETFRLPVSAQKTAQFPNGYMEWTKIGVLNETGEISTLKINNALTTWKDQSLNRLSFAPNINDSIGALVNAPVFINYYYDGNYFNLYGAGGGLIQYGSCTVDEKNNLVVLHPEFQYKDIMFECIIAPQRDVDYKVLTALQEAIIAFIEWKLKLNTETNFYNEVKKARRRLPKKKVDLQTINQVIRESEAMKLRA